MSFIKRIHLRRAITGVMVIKAMFAGSIALLALFGVVVPQFGIELSFLGESVAAGTGAAAGIAAAIFRV